MRRRLLCPGFVPELPPVCAALLLPCRRRRRRRRFIQSRDMNELDPGRDHATRRRGDPV